MAKATDEWGPKLQVHRAETDRPKHIDSQVPLAASQDVDGMDDDNNGLSDTTYEPGLGNDDDQEGLQFNPPPAFQMVIVDETGL